DGTGSFVNMGIFNSNPSAGNTVDFFGVPITAPSTGSLNVQTGTLRVRTGSTIGGTVNVSSGAHMEFRSGSYHFGVTNPTFVGQGSLDFPVAGVTFTTSTSGTPISIPNTVNLSAGTWVI